MAWSLDARIPLVTVADAAGLATALGRGRPAAVLAEAPAVGVAAGGVPEGATGAVALESFEAVASAHAAACTCCAGRGPAAAALDRLFQARVRGKVSWFERVVALAETQAGREAIAQALTQDALTAARFRAG